MTGDPREEQLLAQRDAVLPAATLAAAVGTTVLSVVCVWQASPQGVGLNAQLGPSGGQWAAVVFGAIAVLLFACARRWPGPGMIGTATASALLAAIIAMTGIDSDWRVTGPGPWLTAAGFVLTAGLGAMWARAAS